MNEKDPIAMACPICERRAFDTTGIPEQPISIVLKCPNCGKLVSIPLEPNAALRISPGYVRRKSFALATTKREVRRWPRDGQPVRMVTYRAKAPFSDPSKA